MRWCDRLRLLLNAARGDANARSLVLWRLAGADHLLSTHPLRPGDVVYDVGGYRGDWVAEMRGRYPCDYWVFEPHPDAFRALRARFEGADDVHLVEAALGRGNARVLLSSDAEGSSIVKSGSADGVEVELLDASAFLVAHHGQVALMAINIEGAEYDLLEGLLDHGLCPRIGAFLVQFHAGAPGAAARYDAIAGRLAATHDLSWRYPFLWELWTRREAPADDQGHAGTAVHEGSNQSRVSVPGRSQ